MPETSAVRWHNRLVSLGPDTFGDFLPCHAPRFCSGHGRTRPVEVLPGRAPQGLPRTENKSRAAFAETFGSWLSLHCDRPQRGVRGNCLWNPAATLPDPCSALPDLLRTSQVVRASNTMVHSTVTPVQYRFVSRLTTQTCCPCVNGLRKQPGDSRKLAMNKMPKKTKPRTLKRFIPVQPKSAKRARSRVVTSEDKRKDPKKS